MQGTPEGNSSQEDMDIVYGVEDGIKMLKISQGSITESGAISKLKISSKSLPGVLEEMDVLDEVGDCVKVLIYKYC